ncbi:uncharacterized protein, partial [Sinocyclocheilus grahami]|uniref:uncharacterized protein n=1 Tax=Sinocyclocheilus grahami TaxID=75366 RepID=UPI0007ACD549
MSPIQWALNYQIRAAILTEPAPPGGSEGKNYVPSTLRITLLDSVHTSPGSGHPGSRRTLSLLQNRYWWPNMARDVAPVYQRMFGLFHLHHATSSARGINKNTYVAFKRGKHAEALCKSDTRSPKSLDGVVEFFLSPKLKTQGEKCRAWIKQCGRPHSQLNVDRINKNTYVCSKHFANRRPTPEYPNPIAALQGLLLRREHQGACRRSPRKRKPAPQTPLRTHFTVHHNRVTLPMSSAHITKKSHQGIPGQSWQLFFAGHLISKRPKLVPSTTLLSGDVPRCGAWGFTTKPQGYTRLPVTFEYCCAATGSSSTPLLIALVCILDVPLVLTAKVSKVGSPRA